MNYFVFLAYRVERSITSIDILFFTLVLRPKLSLYLDNNKEDLFRIM